MKIKKNLSESITASDMDKILLSNFYNYNSLKKDIVKLKKAYLNYIEEELKKVNIGYPVDEVGDLLYELYVKYDEREVDYDFEELMDKIMNITKNKLKKFFEELKEDISKL